MALSTGDRHMGSCQRERSHRIVVELSIQPGGRGVTLRTGLREPQADVIGILGIVEVCLVTTDAIRRRPLEATADMARKAIQRCMGSGQWKSCQLPVIEAGAQPRVKAAVALLARGRESARLMIGSGRAHESSGVANDAISGQSFELPCRRTRVTGITLQNRVCPEKRKTILVFANRTQRYHPPIHGVALFALGAHLPSMDIGVTIGALVSYIREHQVHVTLRAANVLMHSPQWIPRLIVIKLRNVANRLPARKGVAVLARDV